MLDLSEDDRLGLKTLLISILSSKEFTVETSKELSNFIHLSVDRRFPKPSEIPVLPRMSIPLIHALVAYKFIAPTGPLNNDFFYKRFIRLMGESRQNVNDYFKNLPKLSDEAEIYKTNLLEWLNKLQKVLTKAIYPKD